MKRLALIACMLFVAAQGNQMTLPVFTVASGNWRNGDSIPAKYTCDGENISPELHWSHAPLATKSFALIVDDPDAPHGTFVHWVLFDIPSTVTRLPENTAHGVQGVTSFKSNNYGGPCPPYSADAAKGKPDGTHHYRFILYALDSMLKLSASATKEDVLAAMQGHVLGQAKLTGLYKRK